MLCFFYGSGFFKIPEPILPSNFQKRHFVLQFTASGLVIEGMSAEEIDALFSKSFLQYFQNNEKFVSQQVSTYVQGIANGIMRGKNLKQLLQWLKDIINGNVI